MLYNPILNTSFVQIILTFQDICTTRLITLPSALDPAWLYTSRFFQDFRTLEEQKWFIQHMWEDWRGQSHDPKLWLQSAGVVNVSFLKKRALQTLYLFSLKRWPEGLHEGPAWDYESCKVTLAASKNRNLELWCKTEDKIICFWFLHIPTFSVSGNLNWDVRLVIIINFTNLFQNYIREVSWVFFYIRHHIFMFKKRKTVSADFSGLLY